MAGTRCNWWVRRGICSSRSVKRARKTAALCRESNQRYPSRIPSGGPLCDEDSEAIRDAVPSTRFAVFSHLLYRPRIYNFWNPPIKWPLGQFMVVTTQHLHDLRLHAHRNHLLSHLRPCRCDAREAEQAPDSKLIFKLFGC